MIPSDLHHSAYTAFVVTVLFGGQLPATCCKSANRNQKYPGKQYGRTSGLSGYPPIFAVLCVWTRRGLNPRPNKELKSFLHAYL